MIHISWLLHPWNSIKLVIIYISSIVSTFTVCCSRYETAFSLPFLYNLIHLIDDNIDLMGGQLVKISLRRHHEERRNYDFTVKHQSDQLNVIVSVLFPKIVCRYIWQFGQPLVYPYLVVLCYPSEVFVLRDLLVY